MILALILAAVQSYYPHEATLKALHDCLHCDVVPKLHKNETIHRVRTKAWVQSSSRGR